MGKRFLANPEILNSEGNKVLEQGVEFNDNVKKMYSTIEEMLASKYISPAGREFGAEVATYQDDFAKMVKLFKDYGSYCINAAKTVIVNEENIIDNFTSGSSQI